MVSKAHGLIEGIEERDKAFFSALVGEDDLGVVVRAHIHIEHELRGYILASAPEPSQVKFSEKSEYGATVQLALILALPAELGKPLLAFGTLRNKFSHKLQMTLGQQEANNLFATLGPVVKSTLHRTSVDFADLDFRDRIILIAVTLRSALLAERLRAEGHLVKKQN